jgi:hypothetical protein
MRGRAPLPLLLGSALAFLASLYLPWQQTAGPVVSPNDAWSASTGAMAGIFALALATSAAAALAGPGLASRVPVGRCALGMAYFGLAAYLQLREVSGFGSVNGQTQQSHGAYGAYVALGCGVVALLVAATVRWPELLRRPSISEATTAALGAGLLVAYLLPWQASLERMGIDGYAATLAAVALWLAASLWRREARPGDRLALAVGVAVLTGAGVSVAGYYPVQEYGVWLGLGLALALVAVAALTAWGRWRPALPPPRTAATVSVSTLLTVSLFLPWQEANLPNGYVVTANGWAYPWGSVAGALALVLVALVALHRFERYPPELVAAIAVSIATLGFQAGNLNRLSLGYGAYIGFAAAALLVLVSLRLPSPDRELRPVRLAALAACLAYLAIAVVPQWGVLSLRLELEAPDRTFWLTVAGIFLAIHLLASWVERPPRADRLVLVPLGLLALVALDLVHERYRGIGWGGIAVVALCLLLSLLGSIERGGDPKKIPLPEILRVDRLPDPGS